MAFRFSLIPLSVFLSAQALCAAENEYDFVVSKNGDGDFDTVQAAFDAVPDFRKNRTTIYLRKGSYKEKLVLGSTKSMVTLVGEDLEETIIWNDQHSKSANRFGEEVGTTGSSGFYVQGSDFIARNVTFENTAGPVGQAVAVRVDGDRVFFDNCRFIGNQDTLYPHGRDSRQYYLNCYIEGTVDFIFGWSTALFENCEIVCKEKGYIAAPSTDEETEFGFVFKNCRILGEAEKDTFYLARPWRDFGKSVFIDCYLGEHIKAEGWHNWRKPEREKTAFFAELNSSGPGADPDRRAKWAHILSERDRDDYALEKVLGGWNPVEAERGE